MRDKGQIKQSVRLFFKSAFLTALAIVLIIIGFFAAGYLFGGY